MANTYECMCGKNGLEVTGEPALAVWCHCHSCQVRLLKRFVSEQERGTSLLHGTCQGCNVFLLIAKVYATDAMKLAAFKPEQFKYTKGGKFLCCCFCTSGIIGRNCLYASPRSKRFQSSGACRSCINTERKGEREIKERKVVKKGERKGTHLKWEKKSERASDERASEESGRGREA
eukprot:3206759-Rhodomonas_salina.1